MLAQSDVAVAGAAAREDRRIAGLELALHLRLLLGPRVDVPVRVDETGHRAHALRVDDLAARARRRAGRHRNDLAAAHDDRAALDDRAVADDDAGIRDREVLRRERRGARRAPSRRRGATKSVVFMLTPPEDRGSSYTAPGAARRQSAPRTGPITAAAALRRQRSLATRERRRRRRPFCDPRRRDRPRPCTLALSRRGDLVALSSRHQALRTVWLSDIHLGSRECRVNLLLDFLRHTRCEQLYLVGDIVDLENLRKNFYWPASHTEALQLLVRKSREGTRIVYIPGNHDHELHAFAGVKFGNIEIARKRFTRRATAGGCSSRTAISSTRSCAAARSACCSAASRAGAC